MVGKTIRVAKETVDLLRKRKAHPRETYDDTISRLIAGQNG